MEILFLTWKDMKHPHAGGAEKVMYAYASGLAKRGHSITWFASSFDGSLAEEKYEGIHIIRRFTCHTIWMFTWWWYKKWKKENRVDVIIDEAGGWPLLAPLYEKQVPIYFFAHHIGNKEFDVYPKSISILARSLYRNLLRVYRITPAIVVSNSTKEEFIRDFEFESTRITVIENTTNIVPVDIVSFHTRTNHILFFGRLTSIKRVDHAVRAFHSVFSELPQDSELHIIGNAQDIDYVKSIQSVIFDLRIQNRVRFLGYLPQDTFSQTLSSYKCMLVPSEKEGYGLVVLEANAHGLPVIGYDVGGLRDSIVGGVNGVLVPDGDYNRMGKEIASMFHNDREYQALCIRSLQHVSTIPTWSEQVQKLEKIITI